MKLFKHMLIGAVVGGIVGFAAPIVLYEFTESRPGDSAGTLFSMMMILTIPAGIGLGGIVGAVFGGGLRD